MHVEPEPGDTAGEGVKSRVGAQVEVMRRRRDLDLAEAGVADGLERGFDGMPVSDARGDP
jgi:hypothetical protein